ncbi:GntR family transcriptional regulator [Actinomadura madurae]|nr:GntR family transcriptional regulator [Actinomadura madurae]MCP9955574.1 GntR family transcriptional regulator [Actinomadura madurae]MCP9972313.1 GntR family transcriptional regulator [Actinomadura madurae]URN01027.1 GntR family transcriptional regulator [Actinomadura madurae]
MSEVVVEQAEGRTAELVRLLQIEERREPAVAHVAIWVARGIVEGRLKPGQDLNSVDLARRFESSRTPVREALMLLESEGLVEIKARRRPRVASFTPERVREIYLVRRHLLALMGSLVTEHITDQEIEDLRDRLSRMQEAAEAGDVDGYFWGHVDLQSRLLTIAGNDTLTKILDSLALRTLVFRHASLARPGRLTASVADQVRIFEAIASRDGELAALLLSRATDAALKAIDLSVLTSSG